MNNLSTVARRGVISVTYEMKLNDLRRLLGGLVYTVGTWSAFHALELSAVSPGSVPLNIGLSSVGIISSLREQDDSFGWLRADSLALPGNLLVRRRVRQLLAFFGALTDATSYKLTVGPNDCIAFCGRWGAGGKWLVAYANYPAS